VYDIPLVTLVWTLMNAPFAHSALCNESLQSIGRRLAFATRHLPDGCTLPFREAKSTLYRSSHSKEAYRRMQNLTSKSSTSFSALGVVTTAAPPRSSWEGNASWLSLDSLSLVERFPLTGLRATESCTHLQTLLPARLHRALRPTAAYCALSPPEACSR